MILDDCDGKEKEGSVISLRQLQEVNRRGGLVSREMIGHPEMQKLEQLSQRLAQVHAWGGAYGKVGFSSHINALLVNRKAPLRKTALRHKCRAS